MKAANHRRPFLKWVLLSGLAGLVSGISAAVFLILLDIATRTRDLHPAVIWFLPFAGLAIGWAYFRFGKDVAGGNNLILEQIHDPKQVLPWIMAPFILVGTVLTHLFGGSAGREGTAVQMGASLSDQISKYFRVSPEERKILLVAGAGAGFGAAIGAPWAGVIFGMEVIQIGRIRLFAVVECFVASFVAYYTAVLLGAPHSVYPKPQWETFQITTLLWIALAGVVFGLVARAFSHFTHAIEKVETRFVGYPPLKPFLAGIFLVLLYWWEGSYRYVGLGIPVIQQALENVASFRDPSFKFLFTALTVGSGFKGGEFIPLVFVGTTLGSALSLVLPVSFGLLGAVGFAAVFAGASNTPIACSLMAIEVFGLSIAPYAVVGCFFSYFVSGHLGIYRSQKTSFKKIQPYSRHRK